jgi:hypothetical protein
MIFNSGFAALLCGKALPFRAMPLLFTATLCLALREAEPLERLLKTDGKPQAFRTAKRQSRKERVMFLIFLTPG